MTDSRNKPGKLGSASPWWARVLLPRASRDEILGDLEEWAAASGRAYVSWQEIVGAAFEARMLTLRFRAREVNENENGRGRMAVGTIMQDLRFAMRTLRKAPAFSGLAVATLALGLGATGAMITVVDSVLLRPLAYGRPDRLVHLEGMKEQELLDAMAYPDIEDVESAASTLAGVFVSQGWQLTLEQGDGTLTRSDGASVSGNYFDVLDVEPALGRFFSDEEGQLGHEPVVVLSHGMWQSRYGSDPQVLGKSIRSGNTQYTIVGVAPASFVDPIAETTFLGRPQLWRARPEAFNSATANRGWIGFWSGARLADGVTLAQAQSELDRIMVGIAEAHPTVADRWIRATPMADRRTGDARAAILLLFGSVIVVLLIASINVANLFLSRATARSREMAVRAALGASRGRIVSQLLTESGLVAIGSGILALGLANVATRALIRLAGDAVPRGAEVGMSFTVVLATMAISLATVGLFGLAPALTATRSGFGGGLRDGARSGGSQGAATLRRTFVVLQLGLAVMLTVSAGLLLKSFWRMHQVDPGLEVESLLTLRITPPSATYPEILDAAAAGERVADALRILPGVTAVGLITDLPMTGAANSTWVFRSDEPRPHPNEMRSTMTRSISHGYVGAAGMRLVYGRDFLSTDTEESPPVALINETTARYHYGAEDPVGYFMTVRGVDREIVGVVADVRQYGVLRSAEPGLYQPLRQENQGWAIRSQAVVIRTVGDPIAAAGAARQAVLSVDPSIAINDIRTMKSWVAEAVAKPRFRTTLLSLFSGVALLLAALGIAGVMAYMVSQREREFAVRMAVGAQQPEVVRLVMAQSLRLTGAGLFVGIIGAAMLSRAMAGFLFGVPPLDPPVFLGASAVLGSVAVLASLFPALRAVRVDPATALRGD